VAELLAAQVELADVLIVARAGALDEARLAHLTAMLQKLNPRARVLAASPAEVPAAELTGTGRFDLDAARQAIGIERPADVPGAPAEGAFSCLAYRRFRPFHPRRFEELVHADLPGVVRSKGVYWLASRPDSAGDWSQVGPIVHHAISGSFWAATPEAEWPVSDERKARIKALWHEPFGDRRQDMVFVVESAHREALEQRLDACLLTDAELALGPAGWSEWAGHDHSANSNLAHADHDHPGHGHDHPVPFRGHTPVGGHHSN
jgi:G3E family GTPase